MPRNGSGTYTLPPTYNPVVNGTTIDPTAFNTTMTDLANAMSASVAADGETPVTGNLPMAGFKHTGAGAPTAAGQYLVFGAAATVSGFTINRATIGGNSALIYSTASVADWTVYTPGGASDYRIANSTADVMTFTQAGNVGIGLAPASTVALEIFKAAVLSEVRLECGNATGTLLRWKGNGVDTGYIGSANVGVNAGAATDFAVQAPGTGNLVLATGIFERVRIDTVGRVLYTANVQPAVNAQRITSNQSLPVSTVTDLAFNSSNTDQNSNYSGSVFTAPVAGVYAFSCGVILQNNGAGSTTLNDIYFSKNNATTVGASRYSIPSSFGQGGVFSGGGGTPAVIGGSVTLRLAATDTVRVKADLGSGGTATPVMNIGSHFSAYLLG